MKKLLIIDDEPKITDAFQLYLNGDYEVIISHRGDDGINMIRNENPDLVVLDWRLNSPIEGRDVLQFIKANYPELPVFVVTASIHFVEEIESLKPTACYLKPCADLKNKITAILPPV